MGEEGSIFWGEAWEARFLAAEESEDVGRCVESARLSGDNEMFAAFAEGEGAKGAAKVKRLRRGVEGTGALGGSDDDGEVSEGSDEGVARGKMPSFARFVGEVGADEPPSG